MRGDAPYRLHQAPEPTASWEDFTAWLRTRPGSEWVNDVRRDQANRWRSGQRILLEEYFQSFPELSRNEEDVLVLIVGEALLRRKMGQDATLEEYQRRFPRLASRLSVQFQLDRLWPSTAAEVVPRIACPVCHNEIERPEDTVAEELVCPACGSRFRLARDVCLDWQPGDQPRRFGKYELIEPVGVGTFGTVYKARDSELDRTVAIKVPRAIHSAAKEDLERFLREARSVAQLRHPGIVSVHEIGQSEKTPYLVSEFVQGATLADLLSSRRPAPREAAELVATVADALHYAHEMGVVHRDVKPANIMLDEQGAPRLMDFGLARRDAADVTMTIDGQVLGKPAYMSPEQARGESRKVDGRSDVYSLGAILYQLLTGELPFRGTTQLLLHQLLNDEPQWPRSVSHLVPRDLETICLKAMSKEAPRRYATARDMADDLRRFLQGEPIHARAVGRAERLWRWCRRKPALAGMTAAATLSLMALAVGGTLAAIQFRQQAEVGEEELYFNSIALAHRDLTASLPNPGRAESLLDDLCLPDYRNWEWYYLKRWRTEPVVLRDPGGAEFNSVSFSPDQTRLAAACSDGTIRVWNLETKEEVAILRGHVGYVLSVAFNPTDGSRLASSGADATVRVWDLTTKSDVFKLPGRYDALRNGKGAVSSLAFSPDGGLVATGDWPGSVRVWDMQSGELLHKLQHGETQPVGGLAFNPSVGSQQIAAGFYSGHVAVWNTLSGKPQIFGQTGVINGIAFHPNGQRLAAASEDRTVMIWDPHTGREILQLRGHTDFCRGLAFSPDDLEDQSEGGWLLASTGIDRTIRLWDASPLSRNDGQEFRTFADHNDEVWSVALSPDGTLCAAAGRDPMLRVWNIRTGVLEASFAEFSQVVFHLGFSRDGQQLAAAGIDSVAPPFVVKLCDVQTHRTVPLVRDAEELFATALQPGGNWLAVGFLNGNIKVAAPIDSQEERIVSLGQHDNDLVRGGLNSRHDGKHLASASRDGVVKVWDLSPVLSVQNETEKSGVPSGHAARSQNAASIQPEEFGHPGIALWSVAYSPDGRHILTGSIDGKLTRWDADTKKELDSRTEASGDGYVSGAYSPNGRWIVSASEDCAVRVYDARTFEFVHQFRGHLGPIFCLAVSDEFVVTGSADKTVKVWDLKPLELQLDPSNQRRVN